ncbi:unnamed protein product [Camellia sinensis]
MGVASKAGCWAFKAFTAGLRVATIYLAATFSINVYCGLSWKPIGLISLLDEDSNFPKATDLTFANKLKQHLSGNPCFKGERGGAFGICHYAGEVFGVFKKKGTKLYEASLKDEKPLDQWLHC